MLVCWGPKLGAPQDIDEQIGSHFEAPMWSMLLSKATLKLVSPQYKLYCCSEAAWKPRTLHSMLLRQSRHWAWWEAICHYCVTMKISHRSPTRRHKMCQHCQGSGGSSQNHRSRENLVLLARTSRFEKKGDWPKPRSWGLIQNSRSIIILWFEA